MLENVGECWIMLENVGEFWRMLENVGECGRMLIKSRIPSKRSKSPQSRSSLATDSPLLWDTELELYTRRIKIKKERAW